MDKNVSLMCCIEKAPWIASGMQGALMMAQGPGNPTECPAIAKISMIWLYDA